VKLNLSGLATVAGLLALWQATLALGLFDYDYLPSPTAIAQAFVSEVRSGGLSTEAAHTLAATGIAWAVAVLVGGVSGVLLGLFAPLRLLFVGSIDLLRPLPTIAFVPVAVLALGFSTATEVAVASVAGLWPMLANTMGGTQSVPTRMHEVGATLRLGRVRRVRSIVLPAAAPMILAGARLALGIVLVVVVVVEMVGNPAGLGYQIVRAQQSLQPEAMFAYVLTVGVIGVALNAILVGASRQLVGDSVDPGRAT
jgi:ABC-type nitrate/sulfonate/bicarbonate transport system permease component